MKLPKHLLSLPMALTLVFASCGGPNPAMTPVINTPDGGKVDLSKVSMVVTMAQITKLSDNKYSLSFDYTIDNQAGAIIAFPCLYNETDDLVEVNLSDREGRPLHLGKRPLEGLTLTEPRPLQIPVGKTTRSYKVPVMPELREKGDPVNIRVRLHAPSRYDELRSSVEAPRLQIPWP